VVGDPPQLRGVDLELCPHLRDIRVTRTAPPAREGRADEEADEHGRGHDGPHVPVHLAPPIDVMARP
jgi:hypothetical protein